MDIDNSHQQPLCKSVRGEGFRSTVHEWLSVRGEGFMSTVHEWLSVRGERDLG